MKASRVVRFLPRPILEALVLTYYGRPFGTLCLNELYRRRDPQRHVEDVSGP